MSSPGSAEGGPLDQKVLLQLLHRMGTNEEFKGMLREFLFSSKTLLGRLEQAAGAGRAGDVEHTAHTLKSMAHIVGASTLEDTCRGVEVKARQAAHVPREDVALLSQELQNVQGAVERFLH